MALITDEAISTPEELRGYESGIYEVASAEGIDLGRKLALAQEEIVVELTGLLFRDDPAQAGRVVVTSPLRLWLLFHALALVYRDAYGSHLNERYTQKRREYEGLAEWARQRLLESGVGMTTQPVPKASRPVVTGESGTAEAGTYAIRTAWVSARGQEGCPSDPAVFVAGAGVVPAVDAGAWPEAAVGWNVYAGRCIDECRLQNPEPLALGLAWTMSGALIADSRRAGDGQKAEMYKRFERILRRG